MTDPGDQPSAVSHDEAEVTDLKARIHQIRNKSRMLWRIAKGLLEGTDRDASAGCKVVAEHTKLLRLAEELQQRADEYTRDDRLVRQAAELAGVRH